MTPDDLIAFEDDIAGLFAARAIRAPVHLMQGAESPLIDIFQNYVRPQDFVLCQWRSHPHCLLKGVPPDELKQAILDGRSISLSFPKYRILSSAIVGGIAPIAVGLALAAKIRNEDYRVVAFLGDMTAETGIVLESVKYAINHRLPVIWVIEDNGKSVNTDTVSAWGGITGIEHPSIIRYSYENKYPHCGLDQWINF